MTITWGTTTFTIDQPAFQTGYEHGRQYFFEDDQQEEGMFSVSRLLSTIAFPIVEDTIN